MLISCPDCQAQVSDAAPACPKCARPLNTSAAPKTNATASRAPSTLSGTAVGFLAGFTLVWGGCGHFASLDSKDATLCALGGAVFAILGALVGAVIGGGRG